MEKNKYTYMQLIDVFMDKHVKRMANFSTEKCREFVKSFKKDKFNDQKFMTTLADKLLMLDEAISDYDSSDIEESYSDNEENQEKK